jgi:hypothetical protein
MIFLLVKTLQHWLDDHGLGFLRVFTPSRSSRRRSAP